MHERAASLVRARGGAAAIQAASVIEFKPTYPDADNPECDAIAQEIDPDNHEWP